MLKLKYRLLIGIGLLLFAIHLSPARAADPVQLVRTGDQNMSCDALAAEINSLADAGTQVEEEANPPKKHGGRGLLRVLSSAAPFVPGVGAAGSLVAAVTASAGSDPQHTMAEMNHQSRQIMARAIAGPSVAEQRKERLTAIFENKHC